MNRRKSARMLIILIIVGGLLWLAHEHRLNKKRSELVTPSSSGDNSTIPPVLEVSSQTDSPVSNFPQVNPGNYTFSFVTNDKLTRTYLVHIPRGYDPSHAYPVLFGFHGGFGNAEQFEKSSYLSNYADERGFIAVYGQGTAWGVLKAPVWNGGACCGKAVETDKNVDDVGYVRKIFEEIKTKYHINSAKVFTTGMSNGGIFSNRLACEASDLFAGAAIVSGTIQITTCTPSKQMRILIIHGTKDTNVPYYGGTGSGLVNATFMPVEQEFAEWGKRNSCTGTIVTTPIPPLETTDGHTVDKLTFQTCTEPVELYRINGGIHEWPSGNPNANRAGKEEPSKALNASKVIVDFFGL